MTRIPRLDPVFLELMPAALEPGKLYISNAHSITTHLCACGCGEKVALPLHPELWRYTYDGKHVSVCPSVGNVGMPCNSHYWIEKGQIDWSVTITPEQARRRHERDLRDVSLYAKAPEPMPIGNEPQRAWWQRLVRR